MHAGARMRANLRRVLSASETSAPGSKTRCSRTWRATTTDEESLTRALMIANARNAMREEARSSA